MTYIFDGTDLNFQVPEQYRLDLDQCNRLTQFYIDRMAGYEVYYKDVSEEYDWLIGTMTISIIKSSNTGEIHALEYTRPTSRTINIRPHKLLDID